VEVLEAMTAPTVDGQPSLPKRTAPKGLLPRHVARTDPERCRRQDVDFMGPARALRAGRGLRGEG
jgi:hypothetical protein